MSTDALDIVDAHHHLWDIRRHQYTWMTDELAPVRRTFDAEDLRATIEPLGVGQTVVVQALQSTDESAELLSFAEDSDRIAGVVGWVDLQKDDVAAAVRSLQARRGGDHLKGVRHLVHDEADPAWLLRSDVLNGLREAAAAGLTFDLLVRERELPAAIAAVRMLPGVQVVLDHAAKPQIARDEWQPWADRVAELAQLPNVTCKISGLVTEASWTTWRPEQLEPYVRWVQASFGSSRLIFGSDWPVCLVAAPYSTVLETARWLLRDLAPEDANAVFAGNARRVYNLPPIREGVT